MPGNEFKYYRMRRIKRNIFALLLLLVSVIVISLFICKRNSGNSGSKNDKVDLLEETGAGYSEKRPGTDILNGGKYNSSSEKNRLSENNGAGTSGKRKPVKRKTSSVEHSTINKVKKVKPEKNLPPKPPTLEIIGEEGKVLMKKE